MNALGRFFRHLLASGGMLSWGDDTRPDSLAMTITCALAVMAVLYLAFAALVHGTVAYAMGAGS